MQQRGFSLIEIMVVIVIMGLLLGVVGPKVLNNIEKAQINTTRTQFQNFSAALKAYKLDNFRYPNTEQGLEALVTLPGADPVPKKWSQYLDQLPRDPWDGEYKYEAPGDGHPFDIYSLGADGVRGGEGQDADLSIWDQDASRDD